MPEIIDFNVVLTDRGNAGSLDIEVTTEGEECTPEEATKIIKSLPKWARARFRSNNLGAAQLSVLLSTLGQMEPTLAEVDRLSEHSAVLWFSLTPTPFRKKGRKGDARANRPHHRY